MSGGGPGARRRSGTAALGLAVAVLVALAAAACSPLSPRKIPQTRYYTLSIPGAPTTAVGRPIELGVFTVAPAYGGQRLAYRSSPWRLDYYTFHRWAAPPAAAVSEAIRDYLERAPRADGAAAVRVSGHLRTLEELDEGGRRYGTLTIELAISRAGGMPASTVYAVKEPAERADPEAVVAALSRALGKAVDQALAE